MFFNEKSSKAKYKYESEPLAYSLDRGKASEAKYASRSKRLAPSFSDDDDFVEVR